MSIQSNINQTLAVAGALYSQSPLATTRREEQITKKEIAKTQKAIDTNQKAIDSFSKEADQWIETAEKEKALYEAFGRSKAAEGKQGQIDRTEAARRDILKTYEDNIDNLKHKKAELSGDYSEVARKDIYEKYIEISTEAKERAEAQREMKKKQLGDFSAFSEEAQREIERQYGQVRR